MDPIGFLIFIPAVVSILLTLQWGGVEYDWGNARIVVLCVLFGICAVMWCFVQFWKQDNATVPPRLVKDRNVYGAVIHATFLGGSFFVFGYYVSFESLYSRFWLLTTTESSQFGSKQSKKFQPPSLGSITFHWLWR
jgi:hypothetical protein